MLFNESKNQKGNLYSLIITVSAIPAAMKQCFNWFWSVVTAGAMVISLQAQDTLTQSQKNIVSVALAGHTGFIFVHSADVENTRGARPWGLQATLLWQKIDEQAWNTCNCYPRQGLLLGYYNYDNQVLGQSAKVGYFLEPAFRLTPATSLLVRGLAGLAYATNPYDPVKNPQNQSYSLPVSAYVALGGGVYVHLTQHYRLNVHVLYEHISNGGLKEPNKGINYPTVGVGLEYLVNPVPIPQRDRSSQRNSIHKKIRWAVYGLATSRTVALGTQARYFIGGLGITASKQVGRMHALTAGLEGYWDFASRERMQLENLTGRSHFRQGVMLGHAFLLGRFTFSQQLGVYTFNQIPYFDRLYHRWGLVYHWHTNWGAGINLKAHRQVANFIDFRLVRRW